MQKLLLQQLVSSVAHIFFTLYGTVFILLYFFFPTVILTFVYPTQMIVILAFVVAYKSNEDQDKNIELQNKDENAQQYSLEDQQRTSVEQTETHCCSLDRHGFLSRNREFLYHFFLYFMPL